MRHGEVIRKPNIKLPGGIDRIKKYEQEEIITDRYILKDRMRCVFRFKGHKKC